MSKEVLTHSESYVKKTNRIILVVGLTSFVIFVIGVMLLMQSGPVQEDYTEPVFTDNDDALNISNDTGPTDNIEFGVVDDGEPPITTTPNPVQMGQVVLGTDAKNVLTLGTNAKAAVSIISVQLAEPPFDGFTFEDDCSGKTLRGHETCDITMGWSPVVPGNVQNNFIIAWHEANLTNANAKSAKVPVEGNAIRKEDCNFCEQTLPGKTDAPAAQGTLKTRNAIGPNGEVIGTIDEDGYVRDANGNVIGRVNSAGMVVDENGNVIGVAENRRLVYDENGNVIGYVNPDGTVVDKDGNIIGRMLPDGTVVDLNGNVIGRAVDAGFVYDKNGNIIGRVQPDGSVVDMNGNVIGRLNEKGEVVDTDGNVIGRVSKQGRVAVDENGNVIGVVMPDGSVVDKNGNIVGFVDENGRVVGKNILGNAGGQVKLAYDKNGKVIGYVDENGNVVDAHGNVIGHVDSAGNVVDENGNVIGKAVSLPQRRLAYDKNGNIMGYIDKDGNVIDPGGNIIGKVQPDGSIVDANGNVIGQAATIPGPAKVMGKDHAVWSMIKTAMLSAMLTKTAMSAMPTVILSAVFCPTERWLTKTAMSSAK